MQIMGRAVCGRIAGHRDQRLRDLWRQDLTLAEIGKRLGFSIASISIKPAALDLPPRRSPSAGRLYLIEEASRRNLSLRELTAKIIATVAKARLVGAVLDDEADAEEAEAEA